MTGNQSRRWVRVLKPWALWAGIAAIIFDAIVLAGHVGHRLAYRREGFSFFENELWDGALDGSYAELLGQAQLLVAAALLLVLLRNGRASVYLTWALVFIALILDDFFMLHEMWGAWLGRTFGFPSVFGLRPDDLGELAVWAGIALVLGTVLLVTHIRSGPTARRNSWWLLLLTAVLALFAVGVDLLHAAVAFSASNMTNEILTVTETAGELGGMTLILLWVLKMIAFVSDPLRSSTAPRR